MEQKKIGRLVVLGGGESGTGSAVLAKMKGLEVLLSDSGQIAPQYKELLERYKIEYQEGGHSVEQILSATEVVKSPGIPDNAPIVEQIRERGIPVISEIEFAGRYCKAKTICITGSNGKTTTTTLAYNILKRAGYNVGLAGNIGNSFALQVATEERQWYVIELSSFQLDGMYQFKADIGVLTNITPDHLDRYDHKMENYTASKMRILQNQGAKDVFIYCEDDPNSTAQMAGREMKMDLLRFGVKQREEDKNSSWQGAAMSKNGEMIHLRVGKKQLSFATSSLKIEGRHNIYNAMAAALATMVAGVESEDICKAIEEFRGVEHRMEYVADVCGVRFINDSKATNIDSARYALDAMQGQTTVWIAGGTDKGNDYTVVEDLVAERVKVLVCMGVDNSKLLRSFQDIVPKIVDTHSLDQAMRAAVAEAETGDTVLLSPACASFDLFKNYEDRGKQFKKWVESYKSGR